MEKIITELPAFKLEEICKVYVGQPHKCMCGCSGKYSYPSLNIEQSGKERGYALDTEDINDKRIHRVLNKVAKNAAIGVEVINEYIYSLVLGSRQYTIYLHK